MLLNQWCIYPAKFLMMKKDNIELIGFIHHPINMGDTAITVMILDSIIL